MAKGLFIKDWTIPDGCYECYFEYDEYYCDIAEKEINCKGKPDWCPLKEIDLYELVWWSYRRDVSYCNAHQQRK